LGQKGIGRAGALGAIHNDEIDGTTKSFLGQGSRENKVWTQEATLIYKRYGFVKIGNSIGFGDSKAYRISVAINISH